MATASTDPYTIEPDVLWPRIPRYRYRIYTRDDDGLRVIAATDTAGGVGEAIIQLHADQKEAGEALRDLGRIGVLDVMPDGKLAPRGEWIVLPFSKGEHPANV